MVWEDTGATETGRPCFVMELVRGIPITQYCDHEKFRTRDRLDLFVQVCYAIQHAHQKGITSWDPGRRSPMLHVWHAPSWNEIETVEAGRTDRSR
ncbi:MAG: hypothetical protein JSW27_06600 [Phycisphaerales bacterium]|nr:MAG: hypothetical protein JSW27_06600 [Phycisphaerales bacterium]